MSTDKLLLDLRAFADAKSGDPRFALLGKLIRNAHSMVSIRLDLERALATMRLLSDQQHEMVAQKASGQAPTEAQGMLSSSLFVTAMFLYARAVHTQGRERSTLDIRASLPPEIRAAHDRILALRNRHFAHYESADLWEDYHVVLVLDDDRMGISYPNERQYLRSKDARALYNVLEHAQPAAEKAYLRASARLKREIDRLIDEDEDFASELGAFPFEPERFFSAEELPGYLASLDEQGWSYRSKVNARFKEEADDREQSS